MPGSAIRVSRGVFSLDRLTQHFFLEPIALTSIGLVILENFSRADAESCRIVRISDDQDRRSELRIARTLISVLLDVL
jgi:hypothetical protein